LAWEAATGSKLLVGRGGDRPAAARGVFVGARFPELPFERPRRGPEWG